MLAAARLLLENAETLQEFEDVVAICRQCIMMHEAIPPQSLGTKERKTMVEVCLCMVRAMAFISQVEVAKFTRVECEESILPLRIALEYQPKSPVCLYELALRLNCLSRHTWDEGRAKSLVRERDEVMQKAATGGYGPAIVAIYIRNMYSDDKVLAECAEGALTSLANHGLFEAGVAIFIWHKTHGRAAKAREALHRCIAAGAKELAEVAEALESIPEKLPPHMTVDFLYSSLLG